MSKEPIHVRIADQFSYRGEHADVWRAFDRFLETDAYLNLGYSPWYLPHFVGASQRRLAAVVGEGLVERLDAVDGPSGTGSARLLDVGSGRGGPASVLAGEFGFDVIGVDLVRYNVETARREATRAGVPAEFVVGDASRLPVATDAVDAATSIDALVYLPDVRVGLDELARVVRPGGVVAISNLLAAGDLDADASDRIDAFAVAWDMPGVEPLASHLDDLAAAGLVVEAVRDLSPHSVDRFRKWTRLYLGVVERAPGLLDRALGRWGLDAARITEQVRAAHDALPHLRHVLVYAQVRRDVE